MSNSVRQVSLAKGYDPRDFALTAFGGAGAIHAGALVEDLGIETIIIPKGTAPVLCALGDLLSDLSVNRVRSFYGRASEINLNELHDTCALMEKEASMQLRDQESHLIQSHTYFSLEMRYLGQTHEVSVPLIENIESITKGINKTLQKFHELHETLYTFKKPEDEIEILSIIFDGDKIKPGNIISGPAVIEETRTSIVLFNNQKATLDAHLNYIIEIGS